MAAAGRVAVPGAMVRGEGPGPAWGLQGPRVRRPWARKAGGRPLLRLRRSWGCELNHPLSDGSSQCTTSGLREGPGRGFLRGGWQGR